MTDDHTDRRVRRNWGSLAVSLAVVVLGLGTVVTTVSVAATTTVTRADYAEYRAGCGDLAGQTRLVEDGLGMERVTLDETHVRQCRNTTYAEYRRDRLASMRRAPFDLRQWVLYLGAGLALAGLGAVLLRQELSARG